MVISQLSQTVANKIKSTIQDPPARGKYDTVKARLIKEFSPSEQGKINKLLSQMELGDRKPTFLLQEMRSLAGTTVDDTFLQTLWMGCLPSTLQQILSPWNDQALNKLAEMADRIIETTNILPLTEASASRGRPRQKTEQNSDEKSPMDKLTDQMRKLFTRIERLEEKKERRDRTPARSTSQHSRKETRFENCWYHHKYGDNATRCRKPCAFKKSEN